MKLIDFCLVKNIAKIFSSFKNLFYICNVKFKMFFDIFKQKMLLKNHSMNVRDL